MACLLLADLSGVPGFMKLVDFTSGDNVLGVAWKVRSGRLTVSFVGSFPAIELVHSSPREPFIRTLLLCATPPIAFVTPAAECWLVALKSATLRSENRAVGPETEIAAIALPCASKTGAATHRMPA